MNQSLSMVEMGDTGHTSDILANKDRGKITKHNSNSNGKNLHLNVLLDCTRNYTVH